MKHRRPDPLLILTFAFAVFLAGFFLGRNYRQTDVLMERPGIQTDSLYLPETDDSAGNAQGIQKVNINTADSVTLQSLPGVGPSIAGRIIAYREENGPFPSAAALIRVEGVGEKLLTEIYDLITVQEDTP